MLPRVAALLDMAQISDVIRIHDQNTFDHPIYAGNAIETVRSLDEKKILTIRATAFDSVKTKQSPCPIEQINKTNSNRTGTVYRTRIIQIRKT